MNVFVSHAPQDGELAKSLANGLRRLGFRPWVAVEKIYPGDNWAVSVADALRDSEAMVAIITPNVTAGSQVRQDMAFAMTNEAFSHRLIPLVVGDRSKLPENPYPWILDRFGVVEIESAGHLEEALERISEILRHSETALAAA